MNKSDQEDSKENAGEANATPRLENQASKPTQDLINKPQGNDVLSEDGIQIEAQTVNSKYKFGSDASEQKASKSEVDDK